MAVTTVNRIKYLKTFIDTWEFTKSDDLNWTLIIADDGSADGSLEFLHKKSKEKLNYKLKVISNRRKGVHYQTNTILNASVKNGFDFGFKADDDIIFLKKNWDHRYIEGYLKNNYDHLVYYNPNWKEPKSKVLKDNLCSYTDPLNCLGCFWTYTPKLINKIGFFDYKSFGFRGNGHIDYTMRACRAGFNNIKTLFDIKDSSSLIGMQPRKGYISTIDPREMARVLVPAEQQRRRNIILDSKRLYIPLNPEIK